MGSTKNYWRTVYLELPADNHETLEAEAKNFAAYCWRLKRPGRPPDEYEDAVHDAIANLLSSQTECDPPVFETVRTILLTSIRNGISTVWRKSSVTAKYRTDTQSQSTGTSSNRTVSMPDNEQFADNEVRAKRQQREDDEHYVELYRYAKALIAQAEHLRPKARVLLVQRLEDALRALQIDPKALKQPKNEPVEIVIAKASRAVGFDDPKRMRWLVTEKFPELRKLLGARTLAEFLDRELARPSTSTAPDRCESTMQVTND